MNRKLSFILFGASLAGAALATPAVSLSGATSPETSNVLLGWTFSASTDIYVTGLGYVDLGADGMVTSHQVGIYDVAANSLVTSATLAAGTTSTKIGDFRYAAADGAKLTAGKRYMIVGTDDSDPWTTNLHSTATFAPGILPDGGAYYNYDNPNSLRMASNTYIYQQYFGPSFTYSTQAVPEPASMAALGLGALGVLRRRKGR